MTSTSLQNFLDGCCVDEDDKIYTIDNFTIVNDGVLFDGSTKADTFMGSDLSDIIWGNGGADVLRGGNERDLLTGAAGNDDLYGGNGNDRLQGWDHDDLVAGGAGRDALYGGNGNDELFGDGGNDYLCAGSGSDELTGGVGADLFVFRPALNATRSTSVYLDFTPGQDKLRIEDYLLPNGLAKSMIKVEADGDLCITTQGGHRLSFENLDRGDIDALYNAITLI
jgi:Ca2+-binding RTX toxin-like protein